MLELNEEEKKKKKKREKGQSRDFPKPLASKYAFKGSLDTGSCSSSTVDVETGALSILRTINKLKQEENKMQFIMSLFHLWQIAETIKVNIDVISNEFLLS